MVDTQRIELACAELEQWFNTTSMRRIRLVLTKHFGADAEDAAVMTQDKGEGNSNG